MGHSAMTFKKSDKRCGWCKQLQGLTHNPMCKFAGEVYESHTDQSVHDEYRLLRGIADNKGEFLTLEEIAETSHTRYLTWHKGEKPWTAERFVTAIVGELGEMANITKKLFRAKDGSRGILNGQTIEQLEHEEEKEWADTMLYMILYARERGWKLSAVVREVFNAKSEQLGFEERL